MGCMHRGSFLAPPPFGGPPGVPGLLPPSGRGSGLESGDRIPRAGDRLSPIGAPLGKRRSAPPARFQSSARYPPSALRASLLTASECRQYPERHEFGGQKRGERTSTKVLDGSPQSGACSSTRRRLKGALSSARGDAEISSAGLLRTPFSGKSFTTPGTNLPPEDASPVSLSHCQSLVIESLTASETSWLRHSVSCRGRFTVSCNLRSKA